MAKHAPWKPGESGNPNGRPRNKSFAEYVRKKVNPNEIIAGVEKIFRTTKSESRKLQAAEFIRDSGWGKPSQSLQFSNPDGELLKVEVVNYTSKNL